MRSSIRYADALALLGADSPALSVLDRALGGALLVATGGGSELIAGLLGARTEAVRVGHELVARLRDRLSGFSRLDRTQRLAAAHTVIAVTAFFEAIDLVDLPFNAAELRLTSHEQLTLLGTTSLDVAAAMVETQLPLPDAFRPYEQSLRELRVCYERLAAGLVDFVHGLAVWDALDDRAKAQAESALARELPERAVGGYEILYRQLSQDVPEFAWWRGHLEHQATRASVESRLREQVEPLGRALSQLETMLRNVPTVATVDDQRAALVRAYRSELNRPVVSDGSASAGGSGDGPILPSLGEAYVDPDFRVAGHGRVRSASYESYWVNREVRTGLAAFLAAHLTSVHATQAPLTVLGQPGAGKSVLTRILASRLPAEAFSVVRVELRQVPADVELQDQIEHAIRAVTGLAVDWPQFVAAGGGATPVVLLDGFDELLQATGVNHSDYLERVARFQQREADQGRPVAVVVTSRTAVADRVRIPAGTVMVTLEPFRSAQIEQWLAVWNQANAASFAANGLLPLSPAAVGRYQELASQPLLLLLLALYDADGNALQNQVADPHRAGADGTGLDAAQLYERLLRAFAEREVRKTSVGVPESDLAMLVDMELLRLSVVAFAMLNRGRQWVSAAELDADLDVLIDRRADTAPAVFRTPLTPADITLGRFFFIHRSQAVRDGTAVASYEFLHATFGEFLVARLTHRVVRDLAVQEHAAVSAAFGSGACQDGLLHALLSFAPLTSRGPILTFLRAMASHLGAEEAIETARLPVLLFNRLNSRTDDRYRDYRPGLANPAHYRYGRYSLNLVLLAAVYAGEVRASALGRRDAVEWRLETIASWRRYAQLWQAVLDWEEWRSVLRAVRIRRTWLDGQRDLVLTIEDQPGLRRDEPMDMYWSHNHRGWVGQTTGWLASQETAWQDVRQQAVLLCDRARDITTHALEPLFDVAGPLFALFGGFVPWQRESGETPDEVAGTVAHALVRLWIAAETGVLRAREDDRRSAPDDRGVDLVRIYDQAIRPLLQPEMVSDEAVRAAGTALVLHRLAVDVDRLPVPTLVDWINALTASGIPSSHVPLFEQLVAATLARATLRDDGTELASLLTRHVVSSATGRVRAWVAIHESGRPDSAVRHLLEGEQSTTAIVMLLSDLIEQDPGLYRRAIWILTAVYRVDVADGPPAPAPRTPEDRHANDAAPDPRNTAT